MTDRTSETVTEAERAVVTAALALADEWEEWLSERRYPTHVLGNRELVNVITTCRTLRKARGEATNG